VPALQNDLPEFGSLLNGSAALIAIVLNLILPDELAAEATGDVSGGLTGHGTGSFGTDKAVV